MYRHGDKKLSISRKLLKNRVYTPYTLTKLAAKCLILVVEQKFKVLWKAKKEIYQNMHSNISSIVRKSAETRGSAEDSHACEYGG